MNSTHRALIAQLRACEGIATKIADFTDDQLLRHIMQNLRGIGAAAQGMKLSAAGVGLMRRCFRAYEIERDPLPIGALALVYLDKTARLPYYITTRHEITMFDPDLAIKLKLADGDIRTLIEIDGGIPRR